MDGPAHRRYAQPVRVAVKQYVHAGAGEQLVQPDAAPPTAHELIGQPVPGAGPPGLPAVPSTDTGLSR